MKKKYLLLSTLLVCSMGFILSYAALSTFAGTTQGILYTSHKTPVEMVFEGTELMLPGDYASGSLAINNDLPATTVYVTRLFVIGAADDDKDVTANEDIFLKNMNIKVTRGILPIIAETYFEGSLYKFIADGYKLDKAVELKPGEQLDLNYAISFPTTAGNECQGALTKVAFGADFGYGTDPGRHDEHTDDKYTSTTTTASPAPTAETVVEPAPPVVAVVEDQPVVEPEPLIALPIPPGILPETGLHGLAGGGLALLMGAGGLALRRFGKRKK